MLLSFSLKFHNWYSIMQRLISIYNFAVPWLWYEKQDILIKLTKAHYIPISADATIICTSLQCREIYFAKYITTHNGLTNRCILVKISMVRCIWLFVSHHVISCTKTYLNIFTKYMNATCLWSYVRI